MKRVITAVIILAVVGAGLGILAWAGSYDVGADRPHSKLVAHAFALLRDLSIAARSRNIEPPDLNDLRMVIAGAQEYSEMCSGCHLVPGVTQSDVRSGLYPQPPDLTKFPVEPKVAFWTIKHGIKMTGMPAWGRSHDDQTIWNIVAFLRRLPTMSPADYDALVGSAQPPAAGHEHKHEEADHANNKAADRGRSRHE